MIEFLFAFFLVAVDADGWQIERSTLSRPLGTQTEFVVNNPHGDIRCRVGAVDKIEVIANAQRIAGDPFEPEIRFEPVGESLQLIVAFDSGGNDPTAQTIEMRRRRIDLTLIVPVEAALMLTTQGGLLEAKGVEGELIARTQNGDMVISSAGRVDARSEHGSIKLDLKSVAGKELPQLETVTGDIELWLPDGVDLNVFAQTEGVISTDFSVEIERDSRLKRARAKLGRGGNTLRIKSIRGAVQLFQSLM